MANLSTLAPPFTRENTAEMARRAVKSRVERETREKAEERQRDIEARALAISLEKHVEPEEARRLTTLKQIDALDKLINKALDGGKEAAFLRLTAAKERLWRLVSPTAGALKPLRRRDLPARPALAPIPETPQASQPGNGCDSV